jgi:hypothetical protein
MCLLALNTAKYDLQLLRAVTHVVGSHAPGLRNNCPLGGK